MLSVLIVSFKHRRYYQVEWCTGIGYFCRRAYHAIGNPSQFVSHFHTGKATAIAQDKGKLIGAHGLNKGCIEFVYCAAGACEYESDGQIYHLMPGMIFVSRPHEVHRQLDCPKGYATFYMLFKPSANESIRWFADGFSRLPRLFSCSRSVSVRFVKILALAEQGDSSLGTRIRIQALIRMLWIDILDSAALSIRQKVPDVFGAIAERMQKHPERDYPLDGLVAESGVSKA